MQVFVKNMTGGTLTLNVVPYDIIADVKLMILDREGTPPEHHYLTYAGKQL